MKFLIIATCLLAVKADGITEDFYIDGVTQQTEVLYNHTSVTSWCSLAVDYEYNYLYIGAFNRAPVILNLNTNEIKPYLGNLVYTRAITVDQETHDLYISAWKGLYKYKPSSGEEQLGGAAGTVRHVYFNGVLYFTDERFYLSTLINGYAYYLLNMQYEVLRLVVDNEDVMFFSNNTGLYSRQMESGHTTLYFKGIVNNLAVDRNGRVYFASYHGIYEIIKHKASYRKVVSISNVKAIEFDKNNNMIYSDTKRIYRLKPKAEVNINNTMNMIKQMETKLDIMDKKIDKLVTDHAVILKKMDRKLRFVTKD